MEYCEIVFYCFMGSICLSLLRRISLRNNIKRNKKQLKLYLKGKKLYTRQEIIDLGKKAIFDPVTRGNCIVYK